ncbi:MAG: prepilin-type N-terminal cleavage/methylation domain-containing protein [Nitrospira sp.]|nr:prepilin-type N-terminal cleavage/methylation domain-containing protein [Nitrospira sp.]
MGCSVHTRGSRAPRALRLPPYASPLTLHPLRTSPGFTILEMLIVMFLLTIVVVVVFPRISLTEDLSSTGRKLVGVLRTVQGLATTSQKPLKLYFDLDQGTYWMMTVEGKEERIPLDPSWKTPRSLPESIRLTEVAIGQEKRFSGRVDVSFFANGRIEPVTMYLTDAKNNLLGLAVDSLTGGIRVSDERLDPPPYQIIPDRVRLLLKPNQQAGAGAPQRGATTTP